MKKIVVIATIGFALYSCKNEKKAEDKIEEQTEVAKTETAKIEVKSDEINWDEIPELKNIGDFPFVTAPTGLKIQNEKDGLSEFYDFETMEIYTGREITTVEGKLGIVAFDGAEGKNFNQKIFDKSIYDYFDGIGAKKLYKGDFPKDDNDRERLEKNMWSGKHATYGLMRESDAPFSVYVFRNKDKKYILFVQSNSAQGSVFIMEVKDFEQTIKKYTASELQNEIDKTGKAVLNINFDTDKATLKSDGQKNVDEILTMLNKNPKLNISIEGHTDNTGSAEKNKQLSTERANTVMKALVGKGIDIKRLKVMGFGSNKPIKPNDTDDNKSQNRRVELVKF